MSENKIMLIDHDIQELKFMVNQLKLQLKQNAILMQKEPMNQSQKISHKYIVEIQDQFRQKLSNLLMDYEKCTKLMELWNGSEELAYAQYYRICKKYGLKQRLILPPTVTSQQQLPIVSLNSMKNALLQQSGVNAMIPRANINSVMQNVIDLTNHNKHTFISPTIANPPSMPMTALLNNNGNVNNNNNNISQFASTIPLPNLDFNPQVEPIQNIFKIEITINNNLIDL